MKIRPVTKVIIGLLGVLWLMVGYVAYQALGK